MDETERVERRIGLHDLRVLMTVVQAGSMGKAARLLATSQPAVSRSVGELEHALGARLLDRSARGVEPTAYGSALLRRGIAVFDELQQAITEIRSLADPAVGALTIGTSIAIAEGFLCALISRLSRRHPRVTLQVHATDTATAYQALLARKVDLALVHVIEPPDEGAMNVETLLLDPHVVVAAPDNPLSRRRRLKLADLVEEPWTLPASEQPYGGVVAEAFRAQGLSPPEAAVTSTLPLRTALLLTGRFVSMVPRLVMQFPPKNRQLRVLPVELPGTARPLALVTLKNRTLNPLAHVFADSVRDAAKVLRKR